MPIVLTCNLLDLPDDDDLKSFVEDHHIDNSEYSKSSFYAVKIWKYFKKELATLQDSLAFNINHVAVFVALKHSFLELIRNSVDANATKIEITLPDVIQKDVNHCITYEDFGKGFDKEILKDSAGKEHTEIDFDIVLNHKLCYPSKKIEQKNRGEKHLNGGAGIGLSLLNGSLKAVNGKLIIGNNAAGGAKIQLMSPLVSDTINFDEMFLLFKKSFLEKTTSLLIKFPEKETIKSQQTPDVIEPLSFPLKTPNKMGLSVKVGTELTSQKIIRRSPLRYLSDQTIHEKKPIEFHDDTSKNKQFIQSASFCFFKQNLETSPTAITPILERDTKEIIKIASPAARIGLTKICGC